MDRYRARVSSPFMMRHVSQGLRSNSEIGEGGGGTISNTILGRVEGTRHFFLLILYNFKISGGTSPPGPPTPRSLFLLLKILTTSMTIWTISSAIRSLPERIIDKKKKSCAIYYIYLHRSTLNRLGNNSAEHSSTGVLSNCYEHYPTWLNSK